MRDEFDDHYATDQGAAEGWRARYGARISTWTGAALGILMIVGAAVWAYNLSQRDANAVPVIRAAIEPVKVQPQDPGGAQIAHQDITSYSAGQPAQENPETATLAPPPPQPAEADVAMGTLASVEPTEETEPAAVEPVVEDTEINEPLPGSGTDNAPGFSPVAARRPNDLTQRMAVAQREASQVDELAQQAAASIVQIQLGAFPDRSQTQAEWQRIYGANQDVLTGRALVIQSTISGGRRFFRVRAGPFKDRTEARNVCRALQARGQDCLVAVNG